MVNPVVFRHSFQINTKLLQGRQRASPQWLKEALRKRVEAQRRVVKEATHVIENKEEK
jgi:hypothetical protein